MNVLVTGTGRCRTAWAAHVLNSGDRICHHQEIRHQHVIQWPVDPADYTSGGRLGWPVADMENAGWSVSSFEAAPLARRLEDRGWKILLLVRDPFDVIRSWLSLGAFWPGFEAGFRDWGTSLRMYAPEVLEEVDPVARATEFYIRWNQLVLRADPTILFTRDLTAWGLWRAAYGEDEEWPHVADWEPGVIDRGTPGRVRVQLSESHIDHITGEVWSRLPREITAGIE